MTATRIESLVVGQSAEMSTNVTARIVELFAEATGDRNPVHLDEEVASRSTFGGRIAHGMLTAGFVSAAIATRLPGAGSIYLGQTLRFTRPVRLGDTVTVKLEVLELIAAKRRVRLATICTNQNGETVVDGEATVMVPDERAPPGG
ncbi:MAG TPA: MaoC family dehydratase [Steroidobacteraceae bacterium]|nr:MaoC family dehydratase [Steroidobacteraceae bacterium]